MSSIKLRTWYKIEVYRDRSDRSRFRDADGNWIGVPWRWRIRCRGNGRVVALSPLLRSRRAARQSVTDLLAILVEAERNTMLKEMQVER